MFGLVSGFSIPLVCGFVVSSVFLREKYETGFSLGNSERGRCMGNTWRKEELSRKITNGSDPLVQFGEWFSLFESQLALIFQRSNKCIYIYIS